MRVLYASTEIYPALKTGGLADVNGALPCALADAGADVRLLLPAFPAIAQAAGVLRTVISLPSPFGGATVRVARGELAGVPAYLIEAGELFARAGNPYVDENGRDWPDNHLRFALLGWAAARFADGTRTRIRIRILRRDVVRERLYILLGDALSFYEINRGIRLLGRRGLRV